MDAPVTVTVRIRARVLPAQRDSLFADPVTERLRAIAPGTHLAVTETVVEPSGEPLEAVLQYAVPLPDAERVVAAILDVEQGVPRGSRVEVRGKGLEFGELAGVAVYLNGTDLPPEVYADADLQALVDDLQRALGGAGQLWSSWQGPTETALYFYGPDAATIRATLAARAPAHPLMERSRVMELTPTSPAGT